MVGISYGILILRNAEYIIVASDFFLDEKFKLVIPQRKCFRRRQEKSGDGNYAARDSKAETGSPLRAAAWSHFRLGRMTKLGRRESPPRHVPRHAGIRSY